MIQPAFVTPDAFYIGENVYPAVVTATVHDGGRFVITLDAHGFRVPPVSVAIDEHDIAACRDILGIGHPAPDYSQPITHAEMFDFRDFVLDFASTADAISNFSISDLRQFAFTARRLAYQIDASLDYLEAHAAASDADDHAAASEPAGDHPSPAPPWLANPAGPGEEDDPNPSNLPDPSNSPH